MQKTEISQRTVRRGRVSWMQCQDDLKTAKGCIRTSPDKSCLLSVQASINALSSVLEAHGHFQLPAFSCVELLNQCLPLAPTLEAIRSQCYVLDGSLDRDLMGHTMQKNMRFTAPYAKTCHRSGQAVIEAVKRYWQENQTRFFKP